jgi:hypothetical protein
VELAHRKSGHYRALRDYRFCEWMRLAAARDGRLRKGTGAGILPWAYRRPAHQRETAGAGALRPGDARRAGNLITMIFKVVLTFSVCLHSAYIDDCCLKWISV